MRPSILCPSPYLRDLNKEIERRGNSQWFIDTTYRIHPARHITAPMVRSSEQEFAARAFFAEVARDGELLARRAGVLHQWGREGV